MGLKSKGYYFTLDAVIGLSILLAAILVMHNFYSFSRESAHLAYVSDDLIDVLSTIKIGEINNSYADFLIANGFVTNQDSSVLEIISRLWVEGQTTHSTNLAKNVSERIVPSNIDFSLVVDGNVVYSRNNSVADDVLLSSKQLITGIEMGRPVGGSTTRLYLSGIKAKHTSGFAYFGGFAGQGNLTVFIDSIPADADITGMVVEVDAGDGFNLEVNGISCGSFSPSGLYNADSWDISSCNSSIVKGVGNKNNFSLLFSGNLRDAYIGGGFVRVDYITDSMYDDASSGIERQYLPDIRGIVNLYDSFSVPGVLNSMTVYLHYLAEQPNVNSSFYMLIGDDLVYFDNASAEKNVTLNSTYLSTVLNYAGMSSQTIPFRVGYSNLNFTSWWTGAADVALITDLSGSMNWRMDNNNNGVWRECDDSSFGDSNTRRLSVAKCLDRQFSTDILNTSGNVVGLVSFAGSTLDTTSLTTNGTILNNTVGTSVPLIGYTAGGSTCICCGINSARDMLVSGLTRTFLVNSGDDWMYEDNYLDSVPPWDVNANKWYEYGYDDSSWSSGASVIGATNGYTYSPAVVTELNSDIMATALFADLWENVGDNAGAPADFSSGILNSTGNTYGISGGDDGWDWDTEDNSGPFGFDDDVIYSSIVGGRIEFDNDDAGSNRCSGGDCSGAYGILINITQPMYDKLQAGGDATVSFAYDWADNANNFESSDQVWIKARWTSPTSGANYLGSDLDSGHSGSDSDAEVYTADNPDTDFSGTFSQEISSWIEGSGLYYLEIGGKIRGSQSSEYGWWSFDDIQLVITNTTDNYYFRKHFNIVDRNDVRKGVMNVLSDDNAVVYLNGELIDEDLGSHDGIYWNRRGKTIPGSKFKSGDNVIAVKMSNSNGAAKLDLELFGLDDHRDKAMMVMTDGVANVLCAEQGTGSAVQDAVQAACDVREDYGVMVYAVGYSDGADEDTLQDIAACGDGMYAKSDNVTELQQFYTDVAENIIFLTRQAQTVEVFGSVDDSTLFYDSYIELNYTPVYNPLSFGEISAVFQTGQFTNCSDTAFISDKISVVDSRVTSYSKEHWTDFVSVNNFTVFDLSSYGSDYTIVGDPFLVYVNPSRLVSGNNTFNIVSADSLSNNTFCSVNNSLIYTAMLKSSVPYTGVKETAEGCKWLVEFFGGSFANVSMPGNYSGGNSCSYTGSSISYNVDDSYDSAMYALLNNLDLYDDGRVFVNFGQGGINVSTIALSDVPYMWGPTLVEVRTWQ